MMAGSPIDIQLALLQRDIEGLRDELRTALYGDGKSRKGLIQQVEDLVEVADRGRWSVRIALWIGGGIVAAATTTAQLKTALTTFWGH